MVKYVIYSTFMSLSSKNTKNIKIQDQNGSSGTLLSWNFKSQIDNLNFDRTTGI